MNKYNVFINIIIDHIIPQTKIAISKGNKIFGAAILQKSDYSLVCVGTNNEIENPLWHGEISALNKFYEIKLNQPKKKLLNHLRATIFENGNFKPYIKLSGKKFFLVN